MLSVLACGFGGWFVYSAHRDGMLGFVVKLFGGIAVVCGVGITGLNLAINGYHNGGFLEWEIDLFWVGVALLVIPSAALLSAIGYVCYVDRHARVAFAVVFSIMLLAGSLLGGLILTVPKSQPVDPPTCRCDPCDCKLKTVRPCEMKGGCQCKAKP